MFDVIAEDNECQRAVSEFTFLVYLIPCLQRRRRTPSSLSVIMIMRYVISVILHRCYTCLHHHPPLHHPQLILAKSCTKKEYVNTYMKKIIRLIFPLYKHFYAPWFLQNKKKHVCNYVQFFYFIQNLTCVIL